MTAPRREFAVPTRDPADDARDGRAAGKPHRYKTWAIRLRNLRWAALQVMLGYSPEQIRAMLDQAETCVSPKPLAKFLDRPLPRIYNATKLGPLE